MKKVVTTLFAGVDEAEFCACLEELAVNAGDDPLNATWLPLKQVKCAAQHEQMSVSCPKEYKKGPEGSKAECTKRWYKKLLADQKSLATFGFVFSSQKSGVLQPPQASNPLPTVSAAPTASGVQYNSWIHVQQKLSAGLSIVLGSSCLHTEWVLLGRLQSGL